MPHVNLDDLLVEEQDPIRAIVQQEVQNQNSVGNGEFDIPERPTAQFRDPEEVASQLGAIFDIAQPAEQVQGLSEQEQARLQRLQTRRSRLQPVQQSDRPISRRIQGNPFSITIGPGLRQLATSVINQQRRRRRFGDPETVAESQRRLENLSERSQAIAKRLAQTDDPKETRRLQREQDRIMRRADRLQRKKERFAGFEAEAQELETEQAESEAARERNKERQQRRGEFIAENTAKALQEQVKTEAGFAEENLKTFNKFQLQERLYQLRDQLEQTKSKLGSPEGRREYASAVNAYARTFLEMAENFDVDIKGAQDLIEDRGYQSGQWYYTQEQAAAGEVPEKTPPELIAPEGVGQFDKRMGDPQYLQLQQQIDTAKTEKQKVLNEALRIYENSTVLNEETRVLRPPTEADKDKVRQMKKHGFSDQQIETFAKGLGFRYEPGDFEEQEQQPEQQSQPTDLSQFETIGDVAKAHGVTEEALIRQVMNLNNLSSMEEARRMMQRQLERARQGQ